MNKKDCESNCRLLFEYLRSILYERPIQKLDLEELEPSYQNLGEGMQKIYQREICRDRIRPEIIFCAPI